MDQFGDSEAQIRAALVGKRVDSVEFNYTAIIIRFSDGTVLEAVGWSAQSSDALDVRVYGAMTLERTVYGN